MALTKVTNSMLDLSDQTHSNTNIGIGYNALSKNGTGPYPGYNNVAIGYAALTFLDGSGTNTNPTGNTAVGYLAAANSQGATNTVVGDSAMQLAVNGDDNTIVGAQANYSNLSGTGNCIYGFQAGYSNLANYNNAFGNLALWSTTTGTSNSAYGGSSLYSNVVGSSNTAIGTGSLYKVLGGGNVGVGYFAGYNATGSNEFYLDNQARTTNANEKITSLFYGIFNTTSAAQQLRINAQLYSGNNSSLINPDAAPTLASAATISPVTSIVFISGTAAIDAISIPVWMDGGGQITLIPTGAFTTTTAGNIAIASTAVVGRALIMTYDKATLKWYPIY